MKKLITACALAVPACIIGSKLYFAMYPQAPVLKDGKIRVACIGDSITQGTGVKKAKNNSYPAQLQKLLGDDYQVLNYGLNGRSVQKGVMMSYTNERFYKISQEIQPNIVVIMLGTNDTMKRNWNAVNYEKDLEAFVQVYQNLESLPVVYLMKPPPIYRSWFGHQASVMENEVILIVQRVAEKLNIQTIDIFTALTNHAELFPDGLHPNKDGATVIAKTVYDALI